MSRSNSPRRRSFSDSGRAAAAAGTSALGGWRAPSSNRIRKTRASGEPFSGMISMLTARPSSIRIVMGRRSSAARLLNRGGEADEQFRTDDAPQIEAGAPPAGSRYGPMWPRNCRIVNAWLMTRLAGAKRASSSRSASRSSDSVSTSSAVSFFPDAGGRIRGMEGRHAGTAMMGGQSAYPKRLSTCSNRSEDGPMLSAGPKISMPSGRRA